MCFPFISIFPRLSARRAVGPQYRRDYIQINKIRVPDVPILGRRIMCSFQTKPG